MSDRQKWEHETDYAAPQHCYTLRKSGAWVLRGEPMNVGSRIVLGYRSTYHDFSF